MARDVKSEINDWVQKVMLSDAPNWTKVEGLVDWLQEQDKKTRIRFHQRRIFVESKHSSPIVKLKNLGDRVRILEIKTLEVQRLKVLEAKVFLLENPKFCGILSLWIVMRATKSSVALNLEKRIDRKMAKTEVSLSTLIKLLEPRG